MSDLISREEVLRMIIVAGECEPNLGYTHLYSVIDSLPSAENSNAKTQNSNQETQNSNQETQKSNGDLIYRADAIEAVGKWMQKEYGYLDLNRAERLIDALSALPSADATCATCADRAMCIMSAPDGNWKACKDYRASAEAVQGWIPCSERLPNTYVRVIVTDSKGGVYENFMTKLGWSKGFNIIAWMPLPKPYKGGDTE